MTKNALADAFASIAANDRSVLDEAQQATEAYKATMDELAARAGYGVLHESATINVVHAARQQAEGTLAAISTVLAEYPIADDAAKA